MATSRAVARPRAPASARAHSPPAWAWLAAIVVVSIAVRIALARRIVAPWIMIDEIVYSELAKSLRGDGQFLVRDVPSPATGSSTRCCSARHGALFDAVPTAYAAAKAINALVMSLAAMPAYLLARRSCRARRSRSSAAVLTVAVPSMLYAGHAHDGERVLSAVPRRGARARRDARAADAAAQWCCSSLLGLAYADARAGGRARARAATAPLLLALRAARRAALRRVRDALRAHRSGRRRSARRRRSPAGARRSAARRLPRRRPTATTASATSRASSLCHAAELDLYLGVLPFAALSRSWFVAARRSPRPRARLAPRRCRSSSGCCSRSRRSRRSRPCTRSRSGTCSTSRRSSYRAARALGRRGVPRPRGDARSPRPASRPACGAVPFERFIGVERDRRHADALPLWSVRTGSRSRSTDALGRRRRRARARRAAALFPRRAGARAAVPRARALPRGRSSRSSGRIAAGVGRRALPGHHDPDATGSTRAVGRDARVARPLVGAHRPLRREPERVLQPQRAGRPTTTATPSPGNLPQTQVAVDPRDGFLRDPDGRAIARAVPALGRRPCPSRAASLPATGRRGRRCCASRSRCASGTSRRGVDDDGWAGRAFSYRAFGCRGARRSRCGSAATRPSSAPAGRPRVRRRPPGRPRQRPARRRADAARRRCAVRCRVVPVARARPRHSTSRRGDAPSRRPRGRPVSAPVRIVFDVSAALAPRTGIGNYILGSLARRSPGGRRATTRSSRSRRRAGAGRA